MTVPSILEEIHSLPHGHGPGVETLRGLRVVAVGGAPMKQHIAASLATAGIPILNHWGVTEIGAISPIEIPDAEYDWRYLRIRDDIRLHFERVEGGENQYHRLVGVAPGSDEAFPVPDLLATNPTKPFSEFRIFGRADDLVVLATGEKVRPTILEQSVAEDPTVSGALAIGDGRFQLGLIIETAPHVELAPSSSAAVATYLEALWSRVNSINKRLDRHAQVSKEMSSIS